MKRNIIIFPDDPYEQKLIAAHDAIMEKCKNRKMRKNVKEKKVGI